MTSKFATAMNITQNGVTWNNALSLSSPDKNGKTVGRMSLFYKSVRGLDLPRLYKYMSEAATENIVDTFLIAFNIRDCRGGKGERDLGRKALIWLFINYPSQFMKIAHLITEYGRADDILQFFPSVLDLKSIDYVRDNYVSVIPDDTHLLNLQNLQTDIVQIFANKLFEDRNLMLQGKPCTITAKWSPTEGDSLDRKSGVYKTLASHMKISPRDLRKLYITPLRSYINIVERFMCSKEWYEIDYNKVPSCAMKRLKKAFKKHDEDRFNEWQASLSKDDKNVAKVNAKQIFPHELIREIRTSYHADRVCEAQWKILEDECLNLGTLNDSIVVVDTSSSMHSPNYLPIDVAVALGLLISNCTKGVFRNHVITFNTTPEFVRITDDSLFNRWHQLSNIPWGGSTNLEGTFRMILHRAKIGRLLPEDMPKRLWIISDMQFNEISGGSPLTNFQAIDKMYAEYDYIRPQIIFWNVNGSSHDFPVTSGENGTALISGFSPSIMKSILNGSDISPFTVLRETLDGTRLNAVKVALGVGSDESKVIE